VQSLRGELEQLRREAEQAERNYDLDLAAELRLGKIPDLERRLEAEEQRLAVALVLVEGMSYKEAAAVLEIPIGTLTSRLARGRSALATALSEEAPA